MLSRLHRIHVILILSLLFSCTELPATAQRLLNSTVTAGPVTGRPLGLVLRDISQLSRFDFSFNSRSVNTDSLISLASFQGSLREYLLLILGGDYEFRESGGHIIIRHAPGSFAMDISTEQAEGKPLIVKGRVLDSRLREGVPNASIYERNLLVSCHTDNLGFFELNIRRPVSQLWLTVSKEHFRDTSLIIFQDVEVVARSKKRKTSFFPDMNESGKTANVFGRLFTSSRQKIQQANLAGFLLHSPFQVSLTPGLSSHGAFSSQIVNKFSLNIIGGFTAGVDGAEIGGIFNINQSDVQYAQVAGIMNLTGGSVRGVQTAGIINHTGGSVSGVQTGGIINHTGGSVSGVQLSGIANTGKGSLHGVQVAGLVNTSGNTKGIQIAGLVNRAGDSSGSQVAGIVNKAGHVSGVQVSGLLNIADSSDYPIGLINLVKKGRKTIGLGTDQSGSLHAAFRSGGNKTYGLIGAGIWLHTPAPYYHLDYGLGITLTQGKRMGLDVEGIGRVATDLHSQVLSSSWIQLLPRFRLTPHLELYAGPSLSFSWSNATLPDMARGWTLYSFPFRNESRIIHAGVSAGIRFSL